MPDHPLVAQTLRRLPARSDGCRRLAAAAARHGERARSRCVARDLAGALAVRRRSANAGPYAFLDDAPLEERRTQAVQNRRYAEPRQRRRPRPARCRSDRGGARAKRGRESRNADEMHEALMGWASSRSGSGREAGWAAMAAGAGARPARDAPGADRLRPTPACGWPPSACRSCWRCYPEAVLQPLDRRTRGVCAGSIGRDDGRCANCCARASPASAR